MTTETLGGVDLLAPSRDNSATSTTSDDLDISPESVALPFEMST
jgi:hypothetical protein